MNLCLVGWMMVFTGAFIGGVPAGTEFQYTGSVVQQSKTPTGETKTFAVTALTATADDGATQVLWSLEERGAGGWTWPERFGAFVPMPNSKGQPIRVLYTHDGMANPIGIHSPLFEYHEKLNADASWSDGRLEYRVARKRKIKERECWQVEVASNLGRSQTLFIDVASGVLMSMDQRIFMGRGDEFQFKMELQSQKPLSTVDFSNSQAAFD